MQRCFATILLGLSALACGKEEPKETAPVEAAATAAKAPKAVPSAAEKPTSLAQLSKLVETQEDYEARANKEITADQLEAEISELEAELAAEPE